MESEGDESVNAPVSLRLLLSRLLRCFSYLIGLGVSVLGGAVILLALRAAFLGLRSLFIGHLLDDGLLGLDLKLGWSRSRLR